MKPRKVPEKIKKLIKEIESHEYKGKCLWNELYEYFDSIHIDSESDMIASLYDGTNAKELIKWLEEGHSSDYD